MVTFTEQNRGCHEGRHVEATTMISQRQITRMLQVGQFQQLVKRILLNGRCRSSIASQLLSQPAVAEPVAIGLALQRTSELWYRTDDSLDELALRLVKLQIADGSVGTLRMSDCGTRIAATSVALRAWLGWIENTAANANCELRESVKTAIGRGLESVRRALLADRSVETSPASWALVVLQLGDRAEFREAVCLPSLMHRLETCGAGVMLDDLFSYARAMAA